MCGEMHKLIIGGVTEQIRLFNFYTDDFPAACPVTLVCPSAYGHIVTPLRQPIALRLHDGVHVDRILVGINTWIMKGVNTDVATGTVIQPKPPVKTFHPFIC